MPTPYEEFSATLERSPVSAQRTYRKVRTAATRQYHDEARAHRAACAALEQSFHKVGDAWVPKKRKPPARR